MPQTFLTELVERIPVLASCQGQIEEAFQALKSCFAGGGKLLICGNGGSAADAEHIAGELLKGFHQRRPLAPDDQKQLGVQLGVTLQGGLPAIPLTGFPALTSAFNNDANPQYAFAQLVWGLGRSGDVILGISTSGNAQNVIAALQTARAKQMKTITLSGESGGELKALSDICIAVPATSTPLIQELHLPVYHCLCAMLEQEFFGDTET